MVTRALTHPARTTPAVRRGATAVWHRTPRKAKGNMALEGGREAATTMEFVEGADEEGKRDERVLRGEKWVVQRRRTHGRREASLPHSRAHAAVQAELDRLRDLMQANPQLGGRQGALNFHCDALCSQLTYKRCLRWFGSSHSPGGATGVNE